MTSKLYPYWVFLTAAEESTISGAARKLGISQPAASTLIRNLERDLGLALLERRSRGVRLTAQGRRVLSQVRKVFIEVETLESMFLPTRTLVGCITLGASHTPGVYWLPSRLATFREQYPQVEVRYRLGSSGELVRDVERGELVQAIVGAGPGYQEETEFRSVPVASEQLIFVGAPGLLNRRMSGDTPPLYWREKGSSTRAVTERNFHKALSAFARRVELPSNEAIKEAVLAGLGFAVLSSWSIRRELKSGALVEVPGFDITAPRQFHAIRRGDTPLLQADLALWSFLSDPDSVTEFGGRPATMPLH